MCQEEPNDVLAITQATLRLRVEDRIEAGSNRGVTELLQRRF
jgi:hypothetical protein